MQSINTVFYALIIPGSFTTNTMYVVVILCFVTMKRIYADMFITDVMFSKDSLILIGSMHNV